MGVDASDSLLPVQRGLGDAARVYVIRLLPMLGIVAATLVLLIGVGSLKIVASQPIVGIIVAAVVGAATLWAFGRVWRILEAEFLIFRLRRMCDAGIITRQEGKAIADSALRNLDRRHQSGDVPIAASDEALRSSRP